MAKKRRKRHVKKFFFGLKVDIWDFLLLIVLFGYPIFYYFNVQNNFLIINEGISEVLKTIGGFVWFGIMGFYILRYFKLRAKKWLK